MTFTEFEQHKLDEQFDAEMDRKGTPVHAPGPYMVSVTLEEWKRLNREHEELHKALSNFYFWTTMRHTNIPTSAIDMARNALNKVAS